MRTWIILISVLLLLVFAVVAESFIISDFDQKLGLCCDEIEEKLNLGSVSQNDFKKIQKIWNNKKDLVYMFANHDSFSDIDALIMFMKNSAMDKDFKMINYYLIKLRECVDSISDSSALSFANIF